MRSHPSHQTSPEASAGSGLSSCLEKVIVTLILVLVSAALLGGGLSGSARSYRDGDCQVSEEFPEKILQWCSLITGYANENGLHPDLVAALILQESGGNAWAYSKSGAVGLMQVMPRDGLAASFECSGVPCFADRPTISELQDPEFNVQYGTQMLRDLNQKYAGNLREALKAYGPIDMGYHYADTVLAIFHRYGRY